MGTDASGEVRQVTTHPRLNADLIREAARDRWRTEILPALGITVRSDKRHGPCPCCGGKDRFRFDDKDGRGSFFCNQCRPQSGDGFALIQKVRGCSFPETLRLVAGILGIDPHTSIDRAALAQERRQRELARLKREREREAAGLTVDACREAEHFIRSRSDLDISGWTNQRLDDELSALGLAHRTLEREALHG